MWLVHVDLASKPRWYRSVNPQTLVPSLVVDGDAVVESIDICRWALAALCGHQHMMRAVNLPL